MKICFAGDVFLGGDIIHKNIEKIDLPNVYKNADFRVVNLESAISDNKNTLEKSTLYSIYLRLI